MWTIGTVYYEEGTMGGGGRAASASDEDEIRGVRAGASRLANWHERSSDDVGT
jgi:hypothetical protein